MQYTEEQELHMQILWSELSSCMCLLKLMQFLTVNPSVHCHSNLMTDQHFVTGTTDLIYLQNEASTTTNYSLISKAEIFHLDST